MTSSAVVLGPGGTVGTAWLAGLAAGLRQADADLGAADLIVGTSADAIVGAVIRLVPDSNATQAFSPDITSLATWVPAYQAGIRQAPQAARLIGGRRPDHS